jgi:hypothetical protein
MNENINNNNINNNNYIMKGDNYNNNNNFSNNKNINENVLLFQCMSKVDNNLKLNDNTVNIKRYF